MKGKMLLAIALMVGFMAFAGSATPASMALSMDGPMPCHGQDMTMPRGHTLVWILISVTNVKNDPYATTVRRYRLLRKGGRMVSTYYTLAHHAHNGCWTVFAFKRKDIPKRLCLVVRGPYAPIGSACQVVKRSVDKKWYVHFKVKNTNVKDG